MPTRAALVPPARARFITGRAADVLPRMNEASYDIVLVDADEEGVIDYVECIGDDMQSGDIRSFSESVQLETGE